MRQFYLENAAGERYDLMGLNGVYLRDPAGLGLSASPSFADLRHGFFVATQTDTRPQDSFTATICFTASPYPTYRDFCVWLGKAGDLKLVYNPDGGQSYFRRVTVKSVQKGELTPVGWLEAQISLLYCTPWYLPSPTAFEVEEESDPNIKRYPYRYSPELRYGSDTAGQLVADITGAGDAPGALLLRYTGPAVNPVIKLTGAISGTVYGKCEADIELLATDTLEYSSTPTSSHLFKTSADGTVTDLLPFIKDLIAPWATVPTDEPCTLTMAGNAPMSGSASVTVYYYYWSV